MLCEKVIDLFKWEKLLEGYKCQKCGKYHEEFPALAFNSPYQYNILSDNDKENIAELSEDFCIIKHEDQTDRFIRVVLYQKIIDSCEFLHYGLWVSLSEKSYRDYFTNFNNQNHEVRYFGWLCSQIPEYDNTLSLKTNVRTQQGDSRPEIVIQDEEYKKSKFAKDFFDGITKDEARKRVESMMKRLK